MKKNNDIDPKQEAFEAELVDYLVEAFPPARDYGPDVLFITTDEIKSAVANHFGIEEKKLPIDSWPVHLKNLDYRNEMGYWLVKSY